MTKSNSGEKAALFGMNIIIKYRYLWFLLIIIFLYGSFQGMKYIVMDDSFEYMFGEKSDIIKRYDQFKELFGNDESVFILFEAEEIFT